ncbi:ATP-dependent DNA helicase RecG [Clostridium homopropionicum DSM 5847]|uniref:ATP-dependent DNA helicase RecG n=1 Tax=Clostridium homopropionicum DSM 5847 TaxID=1121318 RepID=A0A0L6ZC37_9CLOT|nr:ATP-dependent DNA helicase RecG [Clostridium homopropionicum]KOA20535.1 ATP-dependent DNA helicase RecG [Clostridium homopropionicum DSM 5847]SFG37958.1 ATP-dependent DNA helicase RecG [Clostridium homopropionicum]
MNINDDITVMKGVGPKTKIALNKCGIFKILDLILYFPRDYEFNSFFESIEEVKESKRVTTKVLIKNIKKDAYIRRNLILSTVLIKNENILLEAKWFNQPYIKNKIELNREYIFSGTLKIEKNKKIFINPEIKNVEKYSCSIKPKYNLTAGISNNLLNKLINEVLSKFKFVESLPNTVLTKYNLFSLDQAIRNIHIPEDNYKLQQSKERLKFQELFSYCLKLEMLKKYRENQGISYKISPELKLLKEKLPYNLTNAQNRVIREILIDEKKSRPMNRLVQGDVGSGKTIIALIALFNAIKNGYQGVLMAPTEILASQHFEEAKKLFYDFGVNIGLLIGSISKTEKNRVKEELKLGKIDLIVGTHALLEEDVEFFNLGIIVTDEQHRFGVGQRNRLLNKNSNVDVLVMSATPIPRTLALTMYGDLEVSVIDELPPGRSKVDTFFIEKNKRYLAYEFALKEIKKGTQVYIVCPLVEENEEIKVISVEELFAELKQEYFNGIPIEMLYGKMPPKHKDVIIENFRDNKVKVLVSTTVIEVGVNVPNATVMIIENAERFGLSQLHQLRGRVGRGNKKSYCILISDLKSEVSKKRMNIITKSNDGFYIAEEDLKLRGSGEIFGMNQHGEDGFSLANLIDDINLLKIASNEAKILVKSDKKEDIIIKNKIIAKLKETSKLICFN